MKIIHQKYSNIPCQGRDCIHWLGEYEDVHNYDAGYNRYDWRWHDAFTCVWHGEHCAKANDLAKIRESVYNKADQAAQECYNGQYKKPWIQAGEVFDEIKKEWTELKCPFYEINKKE